MHCSFAFLFTKAVNVQTKLLIESQYFPPIAFFALGSCFCEVKLNPFERFEKQTYRNRCSILGSNKVLDLVVPVQKGKTKLTSGEVQVVYAENWPIIHLRAIRSAYGRAPYFEHYYPQIEMILKTKYKTIFNLGYETIKWAAKILDLSILVSSTNAQNDTYFDAKSVILPKGIAPLKIPVLGEVNKPIRLESELLNTPYFQCFNHSGFAPNLSVIDLVMNEGTLSAEYVRQMALGFSTQDFGK